MVQNEINNMSFLISDTKCKMSKVRAHGGAVRRPENVNVFASIYVHLLLKQFSECLSRHLNNAAGMILYTLK